MLKLSVVIPAYNEAPTIEELIRRVRRANTLGLELEIIAVDDRSTDGTTQILERLAREHGVRTILRLQNGGKGAALRDGIRAATGDVVIIQDADLEYDPKEYPRLLQPILDGDADVVYGSRFLGGPHRVLYFWHYVANRTLTMLSNFTTNLNLSDMETCYKVFRREVLERVELECDRFGFEPEITAKVARLQCRVYEVPISYYGRTYEEGKKIGWRDGVGALGHIVRFGILDRLTTPAPERHVPATNVIRTAAHGPRPSSRITPRPVSEKPQVVASSGS